MQPIDQTVELVQFKNCRLIRNGQLMTNVVLWVDPNQGKVIDPENFVVEKTAFFTKQIDCAGQLLAPGFIDIQING